MPPVPRRRSTRYRPPSTSPTGFAAETMPMAPPLRRLRPPNPARDPGTPTHLLANHDPAAHRRAVHRAIVLIGPRRGERDRVGLPIAGLDGAARETGRPLRLDAVRHRSRGGPGPRDRAADRDGVDRGVLSPVVGALEQDVPAHDLTGRTPPPNPTPPPPPHRRHHRHHRHHRRTWGTCSPRAQPAPASRLPLLRYACPSPLLAVLRELELLPVHPTKAPRRWSVPSLPRSRGQG